MFYHFRINNTDSPPCPHCTPEISVSGWKRSISGPETAFYQAFLCCCMLRCCPMTFDHILEEDKWQRTFPQELVKEWYSKFPTYRLAEIIFQIKLQNVCKNKNKQSKTNVLYYRLYIVLKSYTSTEGSLRRSPIVMKSTRKWPFITLSEHQEQHLKHSSSLFNSLIHDPFVDCPSLLPHYHKQKHIFIFWITVCPM